MREISFCPARQPGFHGSDVRFREGTRARGQLDDDDVFATLQSLYFVHIYGSNMVANAKLPFDAALDSVLSS
jgi:hypothetical protein